jgi:tRNA A37 methylthiotransferase MiaB
MKNQVNGNISKQRALQLKQIVEDKNKIFRQKKQRLDVLIESQKDNIYTGYDQFFNSIKIESDVNLIGNWIEVIDYKIEGI